MLHIVAIGWLWVVLMMAITEKSVTGGVLTFVFYGLIPCAVTLYVMGAPGRRRRRLLREQADAADTTKIDPQTAPDETGAAPK
jgi:biotin transporter BioY